MFADYRTLKSQDYHPAPSSLPEENDDLTRISREDKETALNKSATISEILKSGSTVDQVQLEIDYQIIEHFSQHLYGSPNKAVEELVSNSFDALAKSVYVYLPGRFTTEHLVVWDDGSAMDVQGLHQLWWIARSPKDQGERVISDSNGKERKVIGKFGIGKLASYSVGRRITHLCRRGNDFLLVSINYNDLHNENGRGKQRGPKTKTYKTPIIKLTKDKARRLVGEILNIKENPKAFEKIFDTPAWTIAAIGDLKKSLTQNRLSWVLGTGMPLRPDFKVWVNDVPIISKLETNAAITWDFASKEIQQSLLSAWTDAIKGNKVCGEICFGKEKGLDPIYPSMQVPYVDFPNLKKVYGTVRLFDESLLNGKTADLGRSHGFFIFVRDRLLNPEDDKLLLREPNFGTFYRSQYTIHADSLDADLLADRERLSQDTIRIAELDVLQAAVYRVARAAQKDRDDKLAEQAKTLSFMPTRSREHYREPLMALLMKTGFPEDARFDIAKPNVDRKPIGQEKPLVVLSPESGGFQVNTSHPFYVSLDKRLGSGKRSQEFFRAIDLFSISERLLEGYLYDIGIADDKVRQILRWRDELFRAIAENYERVPSDLAMNLRNTSYEGGGAFENALANILGDMGFACERHGATGKEDVVLIATIGPDSYKLTFEAKGSIKPIHNDKAEVSGAASHRDEVGAEHAVIVARCFVGFERDAGNVNAHILKECRTVEGVSIMTVEALISLHEAVNKFNYSQDLLKDVFCKIETPRAKMERVIRLMTPTEEFNYRKLLGELWKRQGAESSGDFVPYKHVWQSNSEWKAKFKIEEFDAKLLALETLAGGRIMLKQQQREVVLKQSPDKIAEHIERTLSIPDE